MDAKEAQEFVSRLSFRFPNWNPPQHVREQLCEALAEFEWTVACEALKRVCGKSTKQPSLQELLTTLRSMSNNSRPEGWPGYVQMYAVCVTCPNGRVGPGRIIQLAVPAQRPPKTEEESIHCIECMRQYMDRYLQSYGYFEYEIYVGIESWDRVFKRRAELQDGG